MKKLEDIYKSHEVFLIDYSKKKKFRVEVFSHSGYLGVILYSKKIKGLYFKNWKKAFTQKELAEISYFMGLIAESRELEEKMNYSACLAAYE